MVDFMYMWVKTKMKDVLGESNYLAIICNEVTTILIINLGFLGMYLLCKIGIDHQFSFLWNV